MDERNVFDSDVTPLSLVEACKGLTALQSEDLMTAAVGRWMRFSGDLLISTNLPLPGLPDHISATLTVPGPPRFLASVLDIFCVFPADRSRLLLAKPGERLKVEGCLHRVNSREIHFVKCRLLNSFSGEVVQHHTVEQVALPPTETTVQRMIAAATEVEAPADKPRLPDAALLAWHKAFVLAYPNSSQTLAVQSATACFPKHSVSRQRVRDLFPDNPVGRPKNSGT